MPSQAPGRRLPVGAELLPQGGVHFRVWAPKRRRIDVVVDGRAGVVELHRDDGGYFAGVAADVRPGALYRFRLDGGEAFPDPASRCQPQGPHGPSQLVDPNGFRWTDGGWRGVALAGQEIYEMHVGTFPRE